MLTRNGWVLGTFAVILASCAVYALFLRPESSVQSSSSVVREAPAFRLRDVSGHEHILKEFPGQVVLVHFWAAWCPPCLAEVPEIIAFARHFEGNPKLKIVTISMDERWEEAEKVLPSAQLPKNMLSLLDAGHRTPEAYGTYQFPETYLISPQGRIVGKWLGGQAWSTPQNLQLIEKKLTTL